MVTTGTDSALSSKTRWTIVGLLSASITINLLDRQVLSVLATELRPLYQWSNAQYAYIAVAFNLGMMCGQVPAGALMDRVGARVGLATIFVAWSVITVLHALAGPGTAIEAVARAILSVIPGMSTLAAGLAGFILLRFIMGLSQCGNYTAGIKALAGLFPAASRARAGGIFNAGAQFGSVIAPPIVVSLAMQFGWRMAFVIPGLVGLLWLLPWLATFPDKQTMATISIKPGGASAGAAPGLTLGQLIANRKVLGLFLIRVFTGPITTFYWTWLPLYLRDPEGRGMSFLAVGFFASVPNLIGMTGNVVGGLLTDRFVKATGSVDRGRKLAFTCAFALGALSMTMPFVANNVLAVLLMGLALFGNQWVAATYIGTVGDVVPQQLAGRVNGIAGFGDNGTALLAVLYTGVIVDRYGWTPVFLGAGTMRASSRRCSGDDRSQCVNFQRIWIARQGSGSQSGGGDVPFAHDGERARTSRVADRRGWVRRSGGSSAPRIRVLAATVKESAWIRVLRSASIRANPRPVDSSRLRLPGNRETRSTSRSTASKTNIDPL